MNNNKIASKRRRRQQQQQRQKQRASVAMRLVSNKQSFHNHNSRPFTAVLIKSALFATLAYTILLMFFNMVQAKGLLHKRSFTTYGCLGSHDIPKFTRLEHVCENCYQVYRDANLYNNCRQDCFKNDVFNHCVDALLLSKEEKKLLQMIDDMYGK